MPSDLLLKKYKPWMIGFIWLMHVSAMIGISIGFQEWFVTKTPINLVIIAVSMLLLYPVAGLRSIGLFILISVLAYFSEWLGVQYGLIFGDYSYGGNLGWKIDGVPFLISINWSVLALSTASIVNKHFKNAYIRIIAASLLMVILDFTMEPIAPIFDFWEFDGGIAPISNYLGWFFVAAVLQVIIQKTKLIGDYRLSLHIYIVQLVFFTFFNVFPAI
jgi:putative membrane protein